MYDAELDTEYGDLVFVNHKPYIKARIIGIREDTSQAETKEALFLLDTGGRDCRVDVDIVMGWATGIPDFAAAVGLGGTQKQDELVVEAYGLEFGEDEMRKPLFSLRPKWTFSKRNIIGSSIFSHVGAILLVDYANETIELEKG